MLKIVNACVDQWFTAQGLHGFRSVTVMFVSQPGEADGKVDSLQVLRKGELASLKILQAYYVSGEGPLWEF